ncbi:hypothetical protein GCM10020258_40620 [Sphingomonas yabuuchiae]
MSKPLPWISPSDADDMVYDDPLGSTPDFSYALLRKSAKESRTASPIWLAPSCNLASLLTVTG